jgi:hypothetical protein
LFTGGGAYSANIGTTSATSLELATSGVVRLNIAAGGGAITYTVPAVAGSGFYTIDNTATNGGSLGIDLQGKTAGAAAQRWIFGMQCFGTAGEWEIRNVTAGAVGFKLNASNIVTMSAYGAGTATFSAAGVISSVSDETWKIKDGVPSDPDAMIQKLTPGYWYYNDENKDTFGADRQLGFYAQNVNAAIGPEAAPEPKTVSNKREDGTETVITRPWGYYDRSVLAVAVMSLQSALTNIQTLTARVATLEAR